MKINEYSNEVQSLLEVRYLNLRHIWEILLIKLLEVQILTSAAINQSDA
jgi:hypothetical protein